MDIKSIRDKKLTPEEFTEKYENNEIRRYSLTFAVEGNFVDDIIIMIPK